MRRRRSVPLQLLWPTATGDVVDDNISYLYADVLWSGLLTGVTNTFLAVFLLRLGGTALQVGLLVSLPSISGTFLSLSAARFVQHHRQSLKLVIIPSIIFRVGYPALAIVPLVAPDMRPWVFVAIIAITSMPTVVSNIAITSQIGDILPADRRAHVIGLRNMLAGASSTVAALVGGWSLALLPFPHNYQIVFVVACVLSLVGLYHRGRLILPRQRQHGAERPAYVPARQVLARPAFRRFSVGIAVYLCGLYLPSALFSIFLVRLLQASDSWIGIVGTGGSLAATLAYPLWGRVQGRGRLRRTLPLAGVGLALFPALVSLSPNVEVYAAVAVFGNLFGAGVSNGITQALMEIGPPAERPTRVAIYNTLAGATAVTMPLLGSALFKVIGIQEALLLAAALRLGGSLLFGTLPTWAADAD